jgi:hypothetical protein
MNTTALQPSGLTDDGTCGRIRWVRFFFEVWQSDLVDGGDPETGLSGHMHQLDNYAKIK